jgi:hypothetical protein
MMPARRMRAVYWRDLVVMSRIRPLVVALAAHVTLLASFLLAWSGVARVPHLPGDNLYEQQRGLQGGLIAVILPWIVCRFLAAERRETWSALSFVTDLSPSRLFDVRLLAPATFGMILVVSGLPLALIAQQTSAIPARRVFFDVCLLALFAIASVVVTMSAALRVRTAIAGWVLSAGAALALHSIVGPAHPAIAAMSALAIAAIALALAPDSSTILSDWNGRSA